MANTINVRDLPEQDVQLLERWVERLRAKVKRQRAAECERRKEPNFATWPLGVKGKLARRGYEFIRRFMSFTRQ